MTGTMNVKEAREALWELLQEGIVETTKEADDILHYADAYGAARELKAHVDACGATNSEKAHCGTGWRGMVWYCEKAQRSS